MTVANNRKAVPNTGHGPSPSTAGVAMTSDQAKAQFDKLVSDIASRATASGHTRVAHFATALKMVVDADWNMIWPLVVAETNAGVALLPAVIASLTAKVPFLGPFLEQLLVLLTPYLPQ